MGDARICVGMCIKPVLNSFYDKSPELWMLRPYSGALYAKGVYLNRKIGKPVEGDTVRFDLDCEKRTCSISFNGALFTRTLPDHE